MDIARGVFVTGTDTGVGKTVVSAALVHALRASGLRVAAMKPVASGCDSHDGALRSDDAMALIDALGAPAPRYEQVNPYALRDPIAPHVAARRDGVEIALAPIRSAFTALAKDADAIVVEGVGGWCVPFSDTLMQADLARALGLPVLLVVGLRLGCINHALLSARAIAADGCTLLGWVGSVVDPGMLALEDNIATLDARLPAPRIGLLPHGPGADAAARSSLLGDAVAALLEPRAQSRRNGDRA